MLKYSLDKFILIITHLYTSHSRLTQIQVLPPVILYPPPVVTLGCQLFFGQVNYHGRFYLPVVFILLEVPSELSGFISPLSYILALRITSFMGAEGPLIVIFSAAREGSLGVSHL